MESMLASPARMVGTDPGASLICNFGLGIGSMTCRWLWRSVLFGVPFRGSIWRLQPPSSLFLLFALGLGLFISTLARNQFVAAQLAFLTTMMPAMMLSGMLFDIAADAAAGCSSSPTSCLRATWSPSCRRCSWPATSGR